MVSLIGAHSFALTPGGRLGALAPTACIKAKVAMAATAAVPTSVFKVASPAGTRGAIVRFHRALALRARAVVLAAARLFLPLLQRIDPFQYFPHTYRTWESRGGLQ
jgi:hypothetical protein